MVNLANSESRVCRSERARSSVGAKGCAWPGSTSRPLVLVQRPLSRRRRIRSPLGGKGSWRASPRPDSDNVGKQGGLTALREPGRRGGGEGRGGGGAQKEAAELISHSVREISSLALFSALRKIRSAQGGKSRICCFTRLFTCFRATTSKCEINWNGPYIYTRSLSRRCAAMPVVSRQPGSAGPLSSLHISPPPHAFSFLATARKNQRESFARRNITPPKR